MGHCCRTPSVNQAACAGLLAAFLVFAAFGQTEQDRRIAALKANLVSKDAQERSAAASALLVMESDAAIEALSATLRATGNDDARVSVLKAVRVKRDIRCLPQAVRLLDDPSPDVRRAAKEAITALPQEQVGKTLLDLLADDKASIRARALAAETLSEIRHFEAVPALIRLLDDERPALRASAELCLRRLTYLAEGPRQEPWLKWWQDNKEKTREELLEDVLRRNEARTEKLMSTAERLWTQALAGRKNLQDPKPLLEAIECELPGVRRWVAEEIVNSKVTAAYPALVRLLRDTNPGVRMAAAQGLGEVADAKDAKVVAPLILALEDLEDPVRAAAARALGNLKSGLAVPRLTPMLKDRGVAQAAAEGLGKIGDPTAAPDLSALLDNIAAPIEARRAAASALGLLHDPRTIGPLLKALDDADLRWFAIHGLGETGQAIKDEALARVLAALTGILQTDQAADNREAAAVALGRLGRVEELTVLARGANDGEQRVADRAVAAFSRIAADRIETYEQHATECGRDKLFLASARLYQAAIDRFGKAPEHAAPVQRMRHARPEMLIKAGEWRDAHEALKRLMALDSKTPCKEPALYRAMALVLLELDRADETLALYAAARRNLPELKDEWWEGSAKVIEALLEQAKPGAANLKIQELRQEDPKLGNDAVSAKLVGLEAEANRLIGSTETPPGLLAALLNKHLAELARDEQARKAAMARIRRLGPAGLPLLIEHGLKHKDRTVQLAAIEIIQDMTGRSFGLAPDHTDEQRAEAVRVWVEQWQASRTAPAPAGKPTPAP